MYFKAVEDSIKHTEFIRRLRTKSKIYPEVIEEGFNGSTYLSTLVRIKRKKVYYLVHLIDCAVLGFAVTKLDMYKRLMAVAYQIEHCYVINDNIRKPNGEPLTEIDFNQESEETRLKKLNLFKDATIRTSTEGV